MSTATLLAPQSTLPAVRPPRVQLESPFAANSKSGSQLNQIYMRAALRDSLLRGEAPFASHALYAQQFVLDDTDPVERAIGIGAGLSWLPSMDKVAVYVDRGISSGMKQSIELATELGLIVEERSLEEWRRY